MIVQQVRAVGGGAVEIHRRGRPGQRAVSASGDVQVEPAVSEHQRCGGSALWSEGTQAMSLVVQLPASSWLKVTRTSSPSRVASIGVSWDAMLLPRP